MLRRNRNTYQHGWIETRPWKKEGLVFVYRWRERKPDGKFTKRSEVIGPVSVLKTEANAWRAIEHRKLEVNSCNSEAHAVTVNMLVNRYLETELAELRYSTAKAYRSYLNDHIKPQWGNFSLTKVKPLAVEQWLRNLDVAPRTRGHLHNLMRVLWNSAMRWELIKIGENPMKLVPVRGTSKRTREPKVLTIAQCQRLLQEFGEPFRTMVILDLATGLRCSELLALKWCDVLWDDLTLLVRRGIVNGAVSDVKTKYSNAGIPWILRLPKYSENGMRRRHSRVPVIGYLGARSKRARHRGIPGVCNSSISLPQAFVVVSGASDGTRSVTRFGPCSTRRGLR
jgi:integrase